MSDPHWPDASSERFMDDDGYERVEFGSTVEPIDDYSEEEFLEWLDLYFDYIHVIRTMQSIRDRKTIKRETKVKKKEIRNWHKPNHFGRKGRK